MVGDRCSPTRLRYKNLVRKTDAQNVLIAQVSREHSAGKLLRDELGKWSNTTDLRIAKEHVKKPKIWILDSTSLMKALNVLIEIPE